MALDQDVVNLAKSIRQVETGNRPVQGGSGELASRYQYMPATWKATAQKYLGDANAPLTLENENKATYLKIKDWKDQGYRPDQIASMWNSGKPDWKGNVGVNKAGVKFDTPAYVAKVGAAYQQFKAQTPKQEVVQEQTVSQEPQPTGGILKNLALGAVKGIGSTIAGASSLGEKYLLNPIDKLMGKEPPRETLGQNLQEGVLKPVGTAQKIGFGAEQLGEYFIPGGAPGKLAKATEIGLGLAKAGKGVAGVSKAAEVAKGLGRLGVRSAVEGAALGGQTAVQQGEFGQEASSAAKFGLAAPVVGKTLGILGEKMAPKLKTSAEKQVIKALGPTTKEMKLKAEKIAPQIIERGIVSGTRKGLLEKAQKGVSESGEHLEKVLESIPSNAKVKLSPVIKSLKKMREDYLLPGVARLEGGRFGRIAAEPKALKAIDDVEDIIKKLGPEASFESVRNLRQIWDKTVAKSKGFLLDEVSNFSVAAKRAAANSIRNELAKKFPDLAKANADYTFWRNLDDVISATVTRTSSQSTPLGEQIMTGAGIGGGLAVGGIIPAAKFASVLVLMRKAMTSTAWRTSSAQVRSSIANAIADGKIEEATMLINRLLTKGQSQLKEKGQ